MMITFIISGLWHGASWNFIVWGAFSGLVLLPSALAGTAVKLGRDDIPCGTGRLPGVRTCLRVLRTFLIVCVGWVLFRAETLGAAFMILRRILDDAMKWTIFYAPTYGEGILMLLVGFCLVCEWIQRRHPHPLVLTGFSRPMRWICYTLLIWGTLYFGALKRGEFIYFQF
jgi:D-alanyl-lipoteichoic acid acyltransferase DltB (MBOAT superfamily)